MAPRPRNRATVWTRTFSAVRKSVAFPTPSAHFRVSGIRSRPARHGVSRRHKYLWPADELTLSPCSQAVAGSETDRCTLDVSLVSQSTWVSRQTEVGFGGRSHQRSDQVRAWHEESKCPIDQIQLEFHWLFFLDLLQGENYSQISAARVHGPPGGRQHLSVSTQKRSAVDSAIPQHRPFDERCAAAPGIESLVSEIDIFISSAGNFDITTLVRMKKL